MKKSQLKEKGSYYYESQNWFDSCPKDLPETPKYNVEIFPRAMTHREILEAYKIVPYASYAEAAAVCASVIPDLKPDYKSRIVYFEENGVTYRFGAWRVGGGQLSLSVGGVNLGNEYGPERGVCFSNGPSEPLGSLDSLVPLELSRAIQICKENGLTVTKTY